jgi:hypothetical protein
MCGAITNFAITPPFYRLLPRIFGKPVNYFRDIGVALCPTWARCESKWVRMHTMSASGGPNVAEIARRELSQLLATAEQAGMDRVRLRRSLRLSQDDWQRWLGILDDAPLPSRPELPLVLRHVGFLTSRLDRAARPAYV